MAGLCLGRLPWTVLTVHEQHLCALDRFDAAPPAMTSAVSIYYDGSVLVVPGGIEMGQGLHTKIKQVPHSAVAKLARACVIQRLSALPSQGGERGKPMRKNLQVRKPPIV